MENISLLANNPLLAFKWAAVLILILGMLGYGGSIVAIYVFGRLKNIKDGWEKSPYLCFGLPCSAIASFGIVSMLELSSKEPGDIKIQALGIDLYGPAAPAMFWIICFVAFVWSIKTLAK